MSTDPLRVSRALFALFEQDQIWLPNGRPAVQITDMDPAWRHNAAQYLARNADAYRQHYDIGEHSSIWGAQAREVLGEDDREPVYGRMVSLAPSPGSAAADMLERDLEGAARQRAADPEGWIKTTPLYKALVKGLPGNAGELAKHWSGCAVREDGGACTCRDYTPEEAS